MELNLEDVIISLQDAQETYYHIPTDEIGYREGNKIYFYDEEEVRDIEDIDDDYIRLPNRDDMDMYAVMEEFTKQESNPEIKKWLTNAIKGKGAFRMFRATIDRFNIEPEWYDFRDKKLRAAAIEWCLENGFEYYEVDYSQDEQEEEEIVVERKEVNFRLTEIQKNNKHSIVYLVMEFRDYLYQLHAIKQKETEQDAKEEIEEYLEKGYPIYAVSVGGLMIGYAVARIEDDVVWLESLYVREDYRNKGVGKMLFDKIQELTPDTVYINVHPNNDIMLSFLKTMQYDVLNLIEVRKAYPKETFDETYSIGNHTFQYKGKE